MRVIVLIIVIFTGLAGCGKTPVVIEEPSKNCMEIEFEDVDSSDLNYELVFDENFDGEALDEEYWSYVDGGGGFGNNEAQYYTAGDNATFSDGYLIISARNEEKSGHEYTSSKIWTRNKFSFKYGKVEVRAKMPDGLGTWPAVWMMPQLSSYGGWPNSGEIDIVEYVGADPHLIHGTIHTKAFNHKKGSQKGDSFQLDDLRDEFHTFTIEWLPDRIKWFIDGEQYYEFFPGLYLDCMNFSQWPFNKEFYLIINLAVGGDWGGYRGIDPEDYPADFVIDYIKVYQAREYK